MTIQEEARQSTLRDDCGKCAKHIIVQVYDFGSPRWYAQKRAHEWHIGGHRT